MPRRKATFEPGPGVPDGKAQTDQQKSEDTGIEQAYLVAPFFFAQNLAKKIGFPFSLQL